MKPNIAINTYNSYVLNVEKFKTFMGTSDVYMNEITAVVIEDYITYMTNVSKNEKSSQKNNLVILKMFFRQAIKEKIINSDDFHFADIRVKSESATKNFLTKEQLEKLTKYKATKLQDYDVYVDMFNFSVYAGGLRFSDVFQLKWSNYIEAESRIRVHIQKTKRDHNFKIGQVAIDILKRYKPANPDNDAYIFNLIKDPIRFESDIYYKNQEIKNYNRTSGKKLSNIGAKLKFPFRLTFHLSRHTFATNALRNGMRIEYVSKIMDHADISTTQIYAKIISEELDKAVDKFIY
jgi:site-specific recombinase XerD